MKDEKYNGWTNYETWLIALYIDNDRGLCEMMDEQVEAFVSSHETDDKPETMNAIADNTGELARILKEWFEDIMEEIYPTDYMPCFYRNCIHSVLRSVDWFDIAQNALNGRE